MKHTAIHDIKIRNNLNFDEGAVGGGVSICFIIFSMNEFFFTFVFSLSLPVFIQYPIEWNNIILSFNE